MIAYLLSMLIELLIDFASSLFGLERRICGQKVLCRYKFKAFL